MAFNSIIASVGRRSFRLEISGDLTSSYNVLSEFQSVYGFAPLGGDLINLFIADGVNITGNPGISGVGLPALAELAIHLGTGANILGQGGRGGNGSSWIFVDGVGWHATSSSAGTNGSDALQLGCVTSVDGSGTIVNGFGGGGGGGPNATGSSHYAGNGGGGGQSLGVQGSGGNLDGLAGTDGNPGTTTDGGLGGVSANHFSGGRGGGSGGAATSGTSGSSAGADGNAVTTNGHAFTHTGVTVTGAIV